MRRSACIYQSVSQREVEVEDRVAKHMSIATRRPAYRSVCCWRVGYLSMLNMATLLAIIKSIVTMSTKCKY